jgi:IS5 family transposase
LYKKGPGQPAELSYLGHVLMENRNGLAVQATVTPATGTAERDAALAMIPSLGGDRPKTLAADRAYDTQGFVRELRALGVTPTWTQRTNRRRSAIDGRTARHPGYVASLRLRKRIEEIFGWLKTVALMRKQRHRGLARVRRLFIFAVALYNLVRIRNIEAVTWRAPRHCDSTLRQTGRRRDKGRQRSRPNLDHPSHRPSVILELCLITGPVAVHTDFSASC